MVAVVLVRTVGLGRRAAAAVKAGRRPPPEAARSGLDGGKPGATVIVPDQLGTRGERQDVITWTGP